ncbi:hypothetical protein D910_06447, partial [Dendroctonus ponderosae]
KQKKSFLILSVALLLILIPRLNTKPPQFSAADNPTAREPSATTRFLTLAYLPFVNFLILVYPSQLSFDWGMDAIPRIHSIRDPRVFYALCFYTVLTVVLGVCLFGILEPRGWFSVSYANFIKAGCIIYHRRNSDTHSHNCRIANNNNTTHNHHFLCVCTAVKLTSQKVTSRHSVLFSLSLIVLPFLPASNLLFYVGFVVAERVLYIPSAGFCLLIGIASAKLWKLKMNRGYLCAGFVLVLAGFSAKTVIRNWDWKNEESLFCSAISFNPPKECEKRWETAFARKMYRKNVCYEICYNVNKDLIGKAAILVIYFAFTTIYF